MNSESEKTLLGRLSGHEQEMHNCATPLIDLMARFRIRKLTITFTTETTISVEAVANDE